MISCGQLVKRGGEENKVSGGEMGWKLSTRKIEKEKTDKWGIR